MVDAFGGSRSSSKLLYFPTTEFSPRYCTGDISAFTFELTGWDHVVSRPVIDGCLFCAEQHVCFSVLVKLGREHYVVRRRYNDFAAFRASLLSDYDNLKTELGEFPAKTWFVVTTDEVFINDRKQRLSDFLNSTLKVLSSKGLLQLAVVRQFFEF